MFKIIYIYIFVINFKWDVTMPCRRERVKFEQFTEFERGRIIGHCEKEFYYFSVAGRLQA